MNSQPLFIPKTQASTPALAPSGTPNITPQSIFNKGNTLLDQGFGLPGRLATGFNANVPPEFSNQVGQAVGQTTGNKTLGNVAGFAAGMMEPLGAPKKVVKGAEAFSAIAKNLPEGGMLMDAARKFEGKPVFDINTDSLIRSDRTGQKELDPAKVQQYRDMIKAGKPTDPIRVDAYDGGLFTEDGKHRLAAHIAENQPFISAIDGTLKSTPRFIKTKTGAFAGSTKK